MTLHTSKGHNYIGHNHIGNNRYLEVAQVWVDEITDQQHELLRRQLPGMADVLYNYGLCSHGLLRRPLPGMADVLYSYGLCSHGLLRRQLPGMADALHCAYNQAVSRSRV